MTHSFLHSYFDTINELCRRYGVVRMYAFGSITTEEFDEYKSDVDLLIELPEELMPEQKGEVYFKLLFELENLLNRRVDLLIERPFQNPYFARSVERSKQLLYAA